MNPIPVRYNLGLGLLLLVLGLFILGVGLLIGSAMQLGLGTLHTLVGLGFLTRPWFVVHDDRIELKNILGFTLKTHSFSGLSELEMRDGKVASRRESFKPLGGWLARGDDMQQVQAAVNGLRAA